MAWIMHKGEGEGMSGIILASNLALSVCTCCTYIRYWMNYHTVRGDILTLCPAVCLYMLPLAGGMGAAPATEHSAPQIPTIII